MEVPALRVGKLMKGGNMGDTFQTPEWLVSELMKRGLNKSQANGKSIATIAELLASDNSKAADRYVSDRCNFMISRAESELKKMRETHSKLASEVESISKTILAIEKSQKEWGEISDQKAKDAISLYAALLAVSKEYGGTDIGGAGYMVWAFLGGQARRIFESKPIKQGQIERRGAGRGTRTNCDDDLFFTDV